MFIRIVDSSYNIYSKVYTVVVDAFQTEVNGVSDGKAETYTIKVSKHIVPTDDAMQSFVESYIKRARNGSIKDWSGMEWHAHSL